MSIEIYSFEQVGVNDVLDIEALLAESVEKKSTVEEIEPKNTESRNYAGIIQSDDENSCDSVSTVDANENTNAIVSLKKGADKPKKNITKLPQVTTCKIGKDRWVSCNLEK